MKKLRSDGWMCGHVAPKDAWKELYRAPRAVACNRTPQHSGPHRRYDRDSFRVLVEWER